MQTIDLSTHLRWTPLSLFVITGRGRTMAVRSGGSLGFMATVYKYTPTGRRGVSPVWARSPKMRRLEMSNRRSNNRIGKSSTSTCTTTIT
eukprot:7878287-Pyramimonas_sp.AAC.1